MIIDAPKFQSDSQKALGAILRSLFWVIYLYLLLPVATLLIWLAGLSTIDTVLLEGQAWNQLVEWLPTYALAVMTLSSVLIVWSLIQQYRFRGRERRRTPIVINPRDISETLDVDIRELRQIILARRLVAHHKADGEVSHFEVGPAVPQSRQDASGRDTMIQTQS